MTRRITRGQAIKKYCKESCCAGSLVDWRECSATTCFLWRFRLGRELLGNQTSFKKTRGKQGVLKEKKQSVKKLSPEIKQEKQTKENEE